MSPNPGQPAHPLAGRNLFGHPVGLSVLFGTEMGERFCYYGMRALLTFYMVDFLFTGTHPAQVLGYATLKGFLEWLNGPLPPQALASLIYGLYTSGTYMTGLFGGFLADAVLGQRISVVLGGLIMAVGEFLLMEPSLFLIGLPVLMLGNGFFKPNISTQVGGLYRDGDSRIDRAYAVFYVGINLGALVAPIVTGRLGHAAPGMPPSWNWGFGAAGIGMLISVVIYLAGQRVLPPDVRARRLAAQARTAAPPARFTRRDWVAIAALCLIAVFNIFFWACFEQQGNTLALLAQDHTNLATPLGTLRPEDVQSFNPFFIFAFTPLIMAFWARQARVGREPDPVIKMAIGCAVTAAMFCLLAIPGGQVDGGGRISVAWLFGAMALQTVGELYLSPVGLSLFSRAAPARAASVMMAVNYLSIAGGNLLAGYLGIYWSRMSEARFFLMIGGIAGATAVGIFLASFLIRPILAARRPG